MTTRLVLQIFCVIFLGIEIIKSQNNTDTTIQYYRKLIVGDTSMLTELNMFLTAIPKGGDLHHHYSGSIYAETYLNWIAKHNYCIYREDDPALKFQKYRIETNVSQLSDAAKALCITADATRLNNDFYRELLKRWSDIDYANHYHDQPPPDQQFFDTFSYYGPVSYQEYNEGLIWLKNTAMNENVQYIETMLTSGPNLAVSNELISIVDGLTSKSNDNDIDRILKIYFDTVENDIIVNATINNYVKMIETAADGINDVNFTLRFQSYVTRSNTPSRVFASLFSAFSAAVRSDLIVGVNIVGAENGIVSMRDYTLHMKMFRFLKRHFPNVKLAMHAGELVLGLVPPEGLQFHIREAIEIAGATRIGHGIDIFYERNSYELLYKMKKLNIAVEAVMSSNEFILGIKNEAHPMLVYKAHGVPLVIATDDAGVSRSTLTNEYLMFCDRYRPSYAELKTLVYNSIHYSFLGSNDKQQQLKRLDDRFRDFEAMIADVTVTLDGPSTQSSTSYFRKDLSNIILFCCSVYFLIELVF
ncbi:unnamed protein product [Adineta steineri]|uniref:adenosine deaminase n=1 Tax=Adineta steineri TaxID=433720 RepID=A0A814G2G1_9BILA|nr:unnamed protein product [Adineta steineri]CAF1176031.1 unnamed protein product [Adineta steineri]